MTVRVACGIGPEEVWEGRQGALGACGPGGARAGQGRVHAPLQGAARELQEQERLNLVARTHSCAALAVRSSAGSHWPATIGLFIPVWEFNSTD